MIERIRKLFAPRVTITRTINTRPMTPEESRTFDAAFRKFDEAFDALRAATHTAGEG